MHRGNGRHEPSDRLAAVGLFERKVLQSFTKSPACNCPHKRQLDNAWQECLSSVAAITGQGDKETAKTIKWYSAEMGILSKAINHS